MWQCSSYRAVYEPLWTTDGGPPDRPVAVQKYNIDDFMLQKVLGKGSFGKVSST